MAPNAGSGSDRRRTPLSRAAVINTRMRAWELYEQGNDDPATSEGRPRNGGTRKPIVSLRHINRLKRLKAARRAEDEQRQRLWGLMYADPSTQQRSLNQREADLDVQEQELRLRELQADVDEAITKEEVSQQQKDRLYRMAMRDINRRKKR